MKYNLYSTRVCSGFSLKNFSLSSSLPNFCHSLQAFDYKLLLHIWDCNFFAYYASSLRFSFVFGVVLLKFLLKLHSMAVQLPGHNFLLFFFTLFYIFGLSLLKFVMLTMCSIICSKKKEELVLGDRVPLVISVA